MDAGVVDEVDDGLVALLVLVAQVLSQVDEQLSAHGLVAVHVGDVLELGLTCRKETRAGAVILPSCSPPPPAERRSSGNIFTKHEDFREVVHERTFYHLLGDAITSAHCEKNQFQSSVME